MKINAKKLSAMAMSAALLSVFCSCTSQVGQADLSATAPAADTTAPAEETTEAVTTTAATTEDSVSLSEAAVKGNFYDCNGRLLLSTDGSRRVSAEPYAVSFANIITTMSAGYDTTFDDILKTPDPTAAGGNVGQSVQLTIDGDLQNEIYDYMQSNNLIGSVVALRSDGSILSQVSYPSYDPNLVESQEYDEELAWGSVGNKAFRNFEPGSCFKIMSEVIADKHGVTSIYDDGTWEVGGVPIVNWDHDKNTSYPIPDRSLYSAFVNSSNIFFAKAFDQIGADAVLSDLSSIFHFGLDDDIECDFGSLENNIEIYCDDDLRRSAFGQSYVLTCPIFLAALGREAVLGDMVTPFVVKNIVDSSDGTTVIGAGSKDNDVIASIPQEYRQNLLSGMTGVGSGLGVYLPAGYEFYAKTGTAETWEGDFLYITGCAKNVNDTGKISYDSYDNYSATGSYIVVMQIQNPEAHGFAFASESAAYYRGLMNIVVGR